MFTIYVLRNETSGKIYIGQTENLDLRIRNHNERKFGPRSFTALNKGRWKLVYKENRNTRKEAIRREKELKSSRGRNFVKTILGP